jgi:hypothetical protein
MAAVFGAFALVSTAHAAAKIHRFNLELGAGATQIAAGNLNNEIDYLNRAFLDPLGLQGFEHFTYSFVYDAGVRFFLRPNIALRAGVGQLRAQQKREYLPAIGQDIQLRYELLSVPMHVGADYYFAPYNQGDFQARGFMGGGLLNMVNNRVLFQQFNRTGGPTGSFVTSIQRDAPGWYIDGGVHMFFAMRYSVVFNAYYRNAKMQALYDTHTKDPAYNRSNGEPFELDLSGIGGRGALCIGF